MRSYRSKIQRYTGLVLLIASGGLQAGEYSAVQAPELARWLEAAKDRPVVVDARGPAAYRTGTIPGALDAGSNPAGFRLDGSRSAIVLLLPQGYDSRQRVSWTHRLEKAGRRVHVLDGGLPAWRRAGYAVEIPEEQLTRTPGNVPFVIPRGICENKPPIQMFRSGSSRVGVAR